MKTLLLIFASTLLTFGAAINSNGTGGGLAGSTSTWAGGVVPGSGDSATILSGDTVTDNIPTWTLGGLLTIKGILTVDGAGIRNFRFASTGGTAWGTDMFGFDVCQSATAGYNLDFSAATASNYITVSSVNGTSPIAFYRDTGAGCANTGYGPVMNLQYMIVSSPCGSSTASVPCIATGAVYVASNSFQLKNSVFSGGGWEAIVNTTGSLTVVNITGNVWSGFSCPGSYPGQGVIWDRANGNPPENILNNVVMNPASNGCVLYNGGSYYPPSAFLMSGNGVFTTPIAEGGLFSGWGAGSLTGPASIQYNIVGDNYASSDWGQPYALCSGPSGGAPPYQFLFQYNILDGCAGMSSTSTYWTYRNNISLTSLVPASTAGCQSCGGVVLYDADHVFVQNSVGVLRTINNGWYPFHDIGYFGGSPGTAYNHVTLIASLPASESTDAGISPGETSSYPVTDGTVQNSIVSGLSWGISVIATGSSFSTVCTWGGGVCNNWVAGLH